MHSNGEAVHPKEVAFVVYPGLTPLDLFGALQVVAGMTLFTQEFRPVVVGESLDALETDTPARLLPDKTFGEVPRPSVLVVPGGGQPAMAALGNETLISYVRSAGNAAEVVASVCTGALILAVAGHLGGRAATTHWSFSKQLERLGSRYVTRRWVEDGKYLTSAGITAGIDMAFRLVQRLAGDEIARKVQLLVEYDPRPPLPAIDWGVFDRDMWDPLVNRWIADGLAGKPAMAARLTKGA